MKMQFRQNLLGRGGGVFLIECSDQMYCKKLPIQLEKAEIFAVFLLQTQAYKSAWQGDMAPQ